MVSTRTILSRLLLWLIFVAFPKLTTAQLVVSCDEHPDCASRLAEAQQKYTQGALEPALSIFQSLFSTYHDPRLLYSVARTLHRLNREVEAVLIYRRFLEIGAEDDPEMLTKVRKQLAEAEASTQAAPSASVGTPPRSSEHSSSSELTGTSLTTQASGSDATTNLVRDASKPPMGNGEHRSTVSHPYVPVQAVPEPVPKRPLYKQWWLWQIVATAVAIGVSGTVAGVYANDGGNR